MAAHPPKPRIAVVTNVMPVYRRDYYRRLFENPTFDTHVFCQSRIPGMNLVVVNSEFGDGVTEVPFWSLKRERLAWQFLPLRRLLEYDVVVVYGNPRVLSNVVYSVLLKVLGKSVVIQGQAHTGGAAVASEVIRLVWWRSFRYLFVYNDGEVRYLRSRGFDSQEVIGMNNGLDQEAIEAAAGHWDEAGLCQWRKGEGLEHNRIVLSVARLEAKNRFDLFVECLPEILDAAPDVVWAVIGTGDEEQRLRERARGLGVEGSIRWLGAIYDEDRLAPWFLSARCLVHPGAIGLSLLHAFGYGLPVVTHDDAAAHMPEIYALQDRGNGLLYRKDDGTDLVAKTLELVIHDAYNETLSGAALATVRERFNTRVMAERFHAIVNASAHEI